MLHVESVVAAALRVRGMDVRAVICDGALRGCVKREVTDGIPIRDWPKACADCHAATKAVVDEMGIPSTGIGELVDLASRDELWEQTADASWDNLGQLHHGGVEVGNNARSAIFRYLQGSQLSGREEIVREYAYSALVSAAAADAAITRFGPTRLFTSHGIYVDWGPALHVAFDRDVPVTAWMASYLQDHFYFRHVEDTLRIDFHNMTAAAWMNRLAVELTEDEELALTTYLDERYQFDRSSFDMKRFVGFSGQTRSLREKYSPAPEKPLWGVMAHINWDCVSDYAPMLHESFDEWIVDTVRQISADPDVTWLIKVHPAEAWENQESGVQRLIEREFPSLPPHVRVIPATEPISPLDFQQMIDGAVTVYGTAGLESALQGKPVILAGEAHYGGKGFTYDPSDRAAYADILRTAGSIGPLDEEQVRLAKKYAYCYFIQRQVPLPLVKTTDGVWWQFRHDEKHLMLPGQDPFVDFLCERIVDDRDFIMNPELVGLAKAALSKAANQDLLSQVS